MNSIIKTKYSQPSSVHIGSRVLIRLLNNTRELEIVENSEKIDPGCGKISPLSPLGQAILGKTAGETVEYTTPLHQRYKAVIQRVYPE